MSKKKYYILIVIGSLMGLMSIFQVRISAATANELYSELNFNGDFLLGSEFQEDKTIVRPAYMGNWASMKNDIVGEDGQAFFTTINSERTYKKGESIYYNNVGFYKTKQTSLKITLYGSAHDTLNGIRLNYDGSLTQKSAAVDSRGAALQLVYKDTKKPVEDIYTEMPLEVYAYSGYNGNNKTWTEVKFSQAGLKKIYLKLPSLKETSSTVSLANWSETNQSFLGVRPSYPYFQSHTDFQNYVAVFDNQIPLQLGAEVGFAYRPVYHYFKSAVETPRVPDYSDPLIEGTKNKEQFSADFVISQSLVATYDKYYPTNLVIVLKDEEKILSEIDPKTIKVLNRTGVDITNKCQITSVGKNEIRIRLTHQLLKELKGDSVRIVVAYNQLDFETVSPFYVPESGSYKLPLTAYTIRDYQGEMTPSNTTVGTTEVVPMIYADPVPQSIIVGGSTAELNLSEMIKGQRSTIPDDEIKLIDFEKTVLFNKVGNSEVGIVLQSSKLPSLKTTIQVPIKVRNEPVSQDYFERQTWLIDEINRQLAPKVIGKTVYESDLRGILTVVVGENTKYTGQFIPKRIDSLQGLTELSYTGNNISKGIPSELGAIKTLKKLDLSHSELTGTIPASLSDLEKLTSLKLNDNNLVKQVPELVQESLSVLDISNNQLTYNSQMVPRFLTNKMYSQTFIGETNQLILAGKNYLDVKVNRETIKPFDRRDDGYFGLAIKNSVSNQTNELLAAHTYRILDDRTGDLLYEGGWDSSAIIPYDRESVYKVILDDAEKNPNNTFVIRAILPELKLASIPEAMTVNLSIEEYELKPISVAGELNVYDNRQGSNWRLSIKPSDFTSNDHTLKGQFYYISAEGQKTGLPENQKKIIESGVANLENPITLISTKWNEKRGLMYQLHGSNFMGDYQGELSWFLEDVPTVENNNH